MKTLKVLTSLTFLLFFVLGVQAQADNLGNHTATENLNMSEFSINDVRFLNIPTGMDNGLRFSGSNNYSISMGNGQKYHYGSVSNTSIKTRMINKKGHGWTWGTFKLEPVAALDISGTMQLKRDMYVMNDLGVGTNTPSYKLHVQDGSIMVSSNPDTGGDPKLIFDDGNYTNAQGVWAIEYFTSKQGLNFFKPWPSPNPGNYKLFLHDDGNIGIGTDSPDYKLDVCGTVRAREVRVETGWCDYVFDEDYCLPSLKDVESFIKEYKHLPEVPAGNVIETEGLKLAEMQATHMLKIEELTLYIIEMNKKIEELESKMATYEKQ